MVTQITKEAKLPKGQYEGFWGGYQIVVEFKKKKYFLKTTIGVRGINIPVTVNIEKNRITFKEL